MRTIDADALQRRICGAKCGCEYEHCGCEGDCHFYFFISNAPTVDAVEVVHGRWLTLEEFAEKIGADATGYSGGWVYCSECDQPMREINGWLYCPNCGAKMDGERK